MTASTPSATMLIGLVIVTGPQFLEVRTLIGVVVGLVMSELKGPQAAVLGQVPASVPLLETQLSFPACAAMVPASRLATKIPADERRRMCCLTLVRR